MQRTWLHTEVLEHVANFRSPHFVQCSWRLGYRSIVYYRSANRTCLMLTSHRGYVLLPATILGAVTYKATVPGYDAVKNSSPKYLFTVIIHLQPNSI